MATIYKTEDGREFNTRSAAESHAAGGGGGGGGRGEPIYYGIAFIFSILVPIWQGRFFFIPFLLVPSFLWAVGLDSLYTYIPIFKYEYEYKFRKLLFIIAGIIVFSAVWAGVDWIDQGRIHPMYVNSDTALYLADGSDPVVRRRPNETSKILGVLTPGEEASIMGVTRNRYYYKVVATNGKKGFVQKDAFLPDIAPSGWALGVAIMGADASNPKTYQKEFNKRRAETDIPALITEENSARLEIRRVNEIAKPLHDRLVDESIPIAVADDTKGMLTITRIAYFDEATVITIDTTPGYTSEKYSSSDLPNTPEMTRELIRYYPMNRNNKPFVVQDIASGRRYAYLKREYAGFGNSYNVYFAPFTSRRFKLSQEFGKNDATPRTLLFSNVQIPGAAEANRLIAQRNEARQAAEQAAEQEELRLAAIAEEGEALFKQNSIKLKLDNGPVKLTQIAYGDTMTAIVCKQSLFVKRENKLTNRYRGEEPFVVEDLDTGERYTLIHHKDTVSFLAGPRSALYFEPFDARRFKLTMGDFVFSNVEVPE
jgi:hypothetical protein